ncbi:hypothetical protein GCM10011506_00150 [Marivirga lumbricoides]|uniref:histidine kinase n=1 Tax=Marivirga lumbricoides TaxID=1046115 RepID=A0ABQ1L792_9BACT|nr:hypothetical protein GCM10011506_00150 [Marivirga lumbricoides]
MSDYTSKKNRNTSALTKLWIVLIIIIITAGSVLFWGYDNYGKLVQSLNTISEPNQKIALINELFQEIVEADNYFNAYALTDDTASRKQYLDKISSVRIILEELEIILADDSLQKERVDSLQQTINVKYNYLTTFLNLKKEKASALFTNEALNRISNQLKDSAFIEKELKREQRMVSSVEPVEKEKIVVRPDEYEGINGFFRKLFGKENLKLDTVKTIEDRINYSLDYSVDTSIVRDYFIDTTLSAVKNILVDVLAEEIDMQQKLNKVELELIKQDQKFIAIIRSIISKLRTEELAKNIRQQDVSRIQAKQLTRELLIIGGIGIALSAIFIFLILRDITRAGLYRRKLEEEKKRAEHLAKVKEEFLSKMSHEIRTPLHSIIGFSDLMSQSELNANQKRYLQAIAESNKHLKQLIDDILDQAKIDAKKLIIEEQPVYIPKLAKELELIFLQKFESSQLSFDVQVSDFFKANIFISDLFKLKQVLMNLIGNAIKFTDIGYVRLSFEAEKLTDEDCKIYIAVEDTGKGIKEEEFSQIFEQFQQGVSGRQIGISGTGLGLSISKSIIEALGGSIAVESEVGIGSVFKINFRAKYAAYSEADAIEIINEELNQSKNFSANILVLEDDPWNAQLLAEILKNTTESYTICSSAEEAITLLKSKPKIDLIFTDINLPEMSGEDFQKFCRSNGLNIPIIALTAHIQKSKKEELLKMGFDAVCIKPFAKIEILQLLSTFLEELVVVEQPPSEADKKPATEIDTSVLQQFAGNNAEVFQELLNTFHEEYALKLEKLDTAYKQKDVKGIGNIAHQLKSALEQIAFDQLSETLKTIELFAEMDKTQRVLEETQRILPDLHEVEMKLEALRHQSHIL